MTADSQFMNKLSKAKRAEAERYFESVLLRAKRFHEALDVKTKVPATLNFYLFGSDCKNTLDGAIVYFDSEVGEWKTLTRGEGFKTIRGEKVSDKSVKQLIYAKGDGTVSKRSFFAETISEINKQSVFPEKPNASSQLIVCELHSAIPSNKSILENFTFVLSQNGGGKLWGN